MDLGLPDSQTKPHFCHEKPSKKKEHAGLATIETGEKKGLLWYTNITMENHHF